MATTRIISMHIGRGKTVAQCLKDRLDYAKNPEKTQNEKLISAYACDPHTADAEFLLARSQYKTITGREQINDILAYQVRQSFRPGEISAEEANKVGYTFASRFLKGKHAFIVATHTDRKHIHNHIIWNATELDCMHKFRDFLGSGRAVARLSDTICIEHHLSVIEKPKRYTHSSYDKWLGDNAQPGRRDLLCADIDAALQKRPKSFEEFLQFMQDAGYEIKRGKQITFCKSGQRNIRISSLQEGYLEKDIRAVIAGEKIHAPSSKLRFATPQKTSLLIDIQAKLNTGKGMGYANWAANYNLKQMAKTVLYVQEHGFTDFSDFQKEVDQAIINHKNLSNKTKATEKHMTEILELKKHIIHYVKTRDVYIGYRKSGYSKKYLEAHEHDIMLHKTTKKAFDELGLKKLPTIKSLQAEYAVLLAEKKKNYEQLYTAREKMRALTVYRENLRRILALPEHPVPKKKEHGRE